MKLSDLLDGLSDQVKSELANNPSVEQATFPLEVAALPITARRWIRLEVFVVYADLMASTSLGTGKNGASTAAIFQAGTGGLVEIFDGFDADFVQIQGDGAFALFWDSMSFERAICAAITVKTFSADLTKRLAARWPDAPETGFKIGVASGRALVKRVGKARRPEWHEPVWAGKPVNYAVKSAQCGDLGRMVVTGSVWDRIEKNDYLAATCNCLGTPSLSLWRDFTIEKLPEIDDERFGRALSVDWCATHGEQFCSAILAGETERDEVNELRGEIRSSQLKDSLRKIASERRHAVRVRRAGLAAR